RASCGPLIPRPACVKKPVNRQVAKVATGSAGVNDSERASGAAPAPQRVGKFSSVRDTRPRGLEVSSAGLIGSDASLRTKAGCCLGAEIDAHADVVLAKAQAGVERRELLEAAEDHLVAAQPPCFGKCMSHQC